MDKQGHVLIDTIEKSDPRYSNSDLKEVQENMRQAIKEAMRDAAKQVRENA